MHEELARYRRPGDQPEPEPNGRDQPSRHGEPDRPTHRPATPAQLRTLGTLARRAGVDLAGLLRREYGFDAPDGLSLRQASGLIDRLKSARG